jgi:hypothetical protein
MLKPVAVTPMYFKSGSAAMISRVSGDLLVITISAPAQRATV